MLKKITTSSVFIIALLGTVSAMATDVPITTFPLSRYNQDINYWINPKNPDYHQPLISLSQQKKQLKKYYEHYCATGPQALSPWGYKYVKNNLKNGLTEHVVEKNIIKAHSNASQKNQKSIGYAENFKPYDECWLKDIIFNMNLKQFKSPLKYQARNRGITVKNLLGRSLPTNDPYFHNFTLPGEGYPFDNLQDSAIWAGTPVYIIGQTRDHQWYLILTSSFVTWVESDGIARTKQSFVNKWQKNAKQKMVAITTNNLSVFDTKKQYRFNTYIGAVFPGKNTYKNSISVLIPATDENHYAKIMVANIRKTDATVMPLRATPNNFVTIMSDLLGRPYGWGNMYFYNDCSAELQSFYTPFGIWLPRNSSQQIKSRKIIDISSLDTAERIKYLQENGKKFTTLVYFSGHIMMYIGNYPNPNSSAHELIAMTYQNIWGLKPKDRSYRSVIGQSALLPILKNYPEDPKLNSQANWDIFQIVHLDETQTN